MTDNEDKTGKEEASPRHEDKTQNYPIGEEQSEDTQNYPIGGGAISYPIGRGGGVTTPIRHTKHLDNEDKTP